MDKSEIITSERIEVWKIDASSDKSSSKIVMCGLVAFICDEGEFSINIDEQQLRGRSGDAVLIFPFQYFRFENKSHHVSLRSLYLPEKYMTKNIGSNITVSDQICHLSETKINDIGTILNMIRQYDDAFSSSSSIVESLSETAINIVLSAINPSGKDNTECKYPDLLVKSFLNIVKEFHNEYRALNIYAEKLSVTPKHLTTVVKKVTGLSAHEWISRFVLQDAKRMLSTTELSAAQIAYSLNFSSPSSFNRFFRKYTGITPHMFRTKK